jgi:flotillin
MNEMFGYRVPAPDEAMLISGRGGGPGGAPFRVVTGHGAFVTPVFRKVRFLTLAMCEAEVAETCVTQQGISLNVRSVIAFKVGNDQESIVNAGQRFLSDQDQMSVLTGRIFAGHLRSIIGSMTVEEIVTERQKLASEVLDGSKDRDGQDRPDRGLAADPVDRRHGGSATSPPWPRRTTPPSSVRPRSPRRQADQAAAEAQQESQRKQAEFARETSVVQAQYKAEVDKAQAEAAQAGPLAQARPSARCSRPRPSWPSAGRAAPAAAGVRGGQAGRGRGRTDQDPRPGGRRAHPKIQAEAAASNNRVALDRMLIDQLPLIVKEAAAGLAGANVSVLNGADGLSEIAAGLVSQGMTILDSVRVAAREQ